MISTKLNQWLAEVFPFPEGSLQAMPGDASFRRYFRLKSGQKSYVVMDASDQMDCYEPFVAIAKALQRRGVAVPEIIAEDPQQGFMLISDFGDRLYLNELRLETADHLYKTALDSLAVIQACPEVENWTLPAFDQHFMQRELDEFKGWFLERYLKLSFTAEEESMLHALFKKLTEAASQQTQVFIHRDYHSANLMIHPESPSLTAVLDFQDACTGPVTYDLVSLLRDCYIQWPDEKVQAWVSYYYECLKEKTLPPSVDFNQFLAWFDWMGLQRHMKALFIFSRKYLRDHTTRYLQHIPRTLDYIIKVSETYPEFQDFHRYAVEKIHPALRAELSLCEP